MLNSAYKIADHHLSSVTAALMAAGVPDFSGFYTTSSAFVWSSGVRHSENAAQLKETIEAIRANYRAQKITNVERQLDHASFVTPDLIVRSHRSNWHDADGVKARTYSTVSVLRAEAGEWKVCVSQFSDRMPLSLEKAEDPATPNPERDQARGALQGVLDSLSQAFLTRCFETYNDCLCPTLVAQSPSMSSIVTNIEGSRDRFDNAMRFLDKVGAHDIVRVAKSAIRLSDDMIIGNFRSYILRGDTQLYPPHQGAVILIRLHGAWKMLAILNGIDMKP
ncbi:hypothetical protein [Pacificoceanicola onchidii]|uniref:hypothetical protein n=1 Tax=Pacificoceanicola onchidii TaxID=2562685 RepID=UPI0010A2FA7D|nr:hypothetical protein [Pacificoceanicola onchidii]